jgi:hypothetical protein
VYWSKPVNEHTNPDLRLPKAPVAAARNHSQRHMKGQVGIALSRADPVGVQ